MFTADVIFAAVSGAGLLYSAAGLVAVLRATRARPCASVDAIAELLPPISVLKPLRGADDDLAANLETFFRQQDADFELVFGVEDARDPAIAIVRALQQRYPAVASRLVVHPGVRAGNPKVSNLEGMLPHARHDLILISDSNVRAPSGYLADLARITAESGGELGIVTNLFAGTGERTLGAALENAQLNTFVAAGAAAPFLMGDAVVVGKSMLMKRSVLERLGGLRSVEDVLAEDYMLGKMFQHAGYTVRIAPVVLENVNKTTRISDFFRRHLRWSMMRARLHPVAFALEPLANPLVIAGAAGAAFGPLGLAVAVLAVVMRDLALWMILRGARRAWIPLLLWPLRDVFVLAAWLATPFKKSVAWRGHRVRLGAGTRVFLPDLRAPRGPQRAWNRRGPGLSSAPRGARLSPR